MENLVVCVSFLGFFVLLYGFILLLRYLNYRETLALADRGLVRPRRERSAGGRGALVWGILIASLGLALVIGLWPVGAMNMGGMRFPLGFGPWMLFGLVPLFFGLGLILIYVLTAGDRKKEEAQQQEKELYPLATSRAAGETAPEDPTPADASAPDLPEPLEGAPVVEEPPAHSPPSSGDLP